MQGKSFLYDPERICAECGKRFDVTWPNQWRYKQGSKWFCSWNCLRTEERIKEAQNHMQIMSEENKTKAIKISLEGGNPLDYLAQIGSKDPKSIWYTIKKELKEKNPELYRQIPDRRFTGGKKPTEAQALKAAEETQKIMQIPPETAGKTAAQTIIDIIKQSSLQVVALKSRAVPEGRYEVAEDGQMKLDWGFRATELKMNTESWKALAGEIHAALRQLEME